ncbi:MAG: NTP transferase domain-containing protein [Chloroflexi bacterium]|nr:NTP transferase domain-containing protein [Chloroflexota bacterium]
MYALILAGGVGTRLWPRSRRTRPKQLLDLLATRTMLQVTYDRIAPLFPPENIFVITGRAYVDEVRGQLPHLPAGQVVGEPMGRGTAPAIGLGVLQVRRRDPNAVLFSLHADHHILRDKDFRDTLQAAADVARDGFLVTLGIQPAHPETGYGYIEKGRALGHPGGHPAFRVARFTEKPNPETARQFVESGRYLWNSGIFAWQASTIMDEMARWMPALHQSLLDIEAACVDEAEETVLDRLWQTVPSESIDVGILERSDNVVVVPADVGWSDVGSWAALLNILPSDSDGNVSLGDHLAMDTRQTLVYSAGRMVATLGVEDLIIVDTDDVVLICPKDRAQDVKKLVDELARKKQDQYL